MGLGAYLCVSVVLFALGLSCMIARRSLWHVLMGLVLALNAVNINFIAFARFHGDFVDGRMFALFVMVLAAAEVVLAFAIILHVARLLHTVKPSALDRLRE